MISIFLAPFIVLYKLWGVTLDNSYGEVSFVVKQGILTVRKSRALCSKVWLLIAEQAGGLNMCNGLAPAVVALRAEERAFLLQ